MNCLSHRECWHTACVFSMFFPPRCCPGAEICRGYNLFPAKRFLGAGLLGNRVSRLAHNAPRSTGYRALQAAPSLGRTSNGSWATAEERRCCKARLRKSWLPVLDSLPVQRMERLKTEWSPPACVQPATEVPPGAQRADNVGLHCRKRNTSPDLPAEVGWGIPFSPPSFVEEAAKAGHPRTLEALLHAVLVSALEDHGNRDLRQRAAARAEEWFKRWTAKSAEFKWFEKALRQAMPPHKARVLGGKNILLWEAMLKEYAYPDLGVVDLMKLGVDLAGQVPASGVFEPCFKPAADDLRSLPDRAPHLPNRIVASVSRPSAHDTSSRPRPQQITIPCLRILLLISGSSLSNTASPE